jgi:transposase
MMISDLMNVAIDVGKKSSYIVVENNGNITTEGYVPTTKDGFSTYLSGLDKPTVIVEASSTMDRVAALLEEYDANVKVAHPRNVKLIAESTKKTDKNDAHTLLNLYKAGYLPEAYLASKEVRDGRNLCRNRDFLVKHRTAVKNRIHDQAFRLGIDFKGFSRKTLEELSTASFPLERLVSELKALNNEIKEFDKRIERELQGNEYAKLLYTIPGVGIVSALGIATEIADIGRFPTAANLCTYAGMVPRIYQSGDKEWKGHISKGNTFLKHLLVQCVQVHIRISDSWITDAYNRIKIRAGKKKAKIAAARKLLVTMYCLLKEGREYRAL